jgi:hypothetical protein
LFSTSSFIKYHGVEVKSRGYHLFSILLITPWHLIIEGIENRRDPLHFTSTPWHLIHVIEGVENSRYPLDFTSTDDICQFQFFQLLNAMV